MKGVSSSEILGLTISQRLQGLLSRNSWENLLYHETSSAAWEFILDFFLFLIILTQLVHNTLGASERLS